MDSQPICINVWTNVCLAPRPPYRQATQDPRGRLRTSCEQPQKGQRTVRLWKSRRRLPRYRWQEACCVGRGAVRCELGGGGWRDFCGQQSNGAEARPPLEPHCGSCNAEVGRPAITSNNRGQQGHPSPPCLPPSPLPSPSPTALPGRNIGGALPIAGGAPFPSPPSLASLSLPPPYPGMNMGGAPIGGGTPLAGGRGAAGLGFWQYGGSVTAGERATRASTCCL